MKHLHYFLPTRQGIIIGAGVGMATKNITVGIIIILIFSLVSYVRTIKY